MIEFKEPAPLYERYSNVRIYTVILNQVQVPLDSVLIDNPHTKEQYLKLVPNELTQTVVQPAGRALTQASHVVSRVRDLMAKKDIQQRMNTCSKSIGMFTADDELFSTYCQPITTITLMARDSYELNHVFQLLKMFNIPVHEFLDYDQPDYGSIDYRVRTAIATEPVFPEQVAGILDYLPLWKPE